jgi:hypothetical protein
MTDAEETKREEKEKAISSSDNKPKVHFSESAAYKYLSGKREPSSICIDTGLYSRFKPLSKRVYSSTCKAAEVYVISLIEAVKNGVHFSDTGRLIQIEKIVIERNLRERRNLELEKAEEGYVHRKTCGFANCRNETVGKAIWLKENEEHDVCAWHLAEICSKDKSWKVIQH